MPPKRRPTRKGRKRRSITSLKIEFQNKTNKRRYTKRYIQKLNYIKLRDSYTCQMPGCQKPTGVKLTVHHCAKFSTNVNIRENKYNLISLCHKCHLSIANKEKKYEARFKAIARRNEANYRKNKKTKEEILNAQRAHQVLPDGFEGFKYKTEDEITKIKAQEYFMTKMYRMMKARIFNKGSNAYKNYGGRGIKMHKEWVDDFKAFEKYILEELGDRPEGATIDRINNEGHYEPGNLRWATAEVQGQNRRTTLLDEASVATILILHFKYNMKIAEIIDKMNLQSRASVSSVIRCATWKNIAIKYKSIITNKKSIKSLEEYEKKLCQENLN